MNFKKAVVFLGVLCFSMSAFAGKGGKGSGGSSLCGDDFTAKYYAPYNGVSDVIGLWDAYNFYSNPENLPIDHHLSIAIIFANYVSKNSSLSVELVQRDLQGNIVPFNASQPTVKINISVGACSSGQTGVLVTDEAPAGQYIITAKAVNGNGVGAQLPINLN